MSDHSYSIFYVHNSFHITLFDTTFLETLLVTFFDRNNHNPLGFQHRQIVKKQHLLSCNKKESNFIFYYDSIISNCFPFSAPQLDEKKK